MKTVVSLLSGLPIEVRDDEDEGVEADAVPRLEAQLADAQSAIRALTDSLAKERRDHEAQLAAQAQKFSQSESALREGMARADGALSGERELRAAAERMAAEAQCRYEEAMVEDEDEDESEDEDALKLDDIAKVMRAELAKLKIPRPTQSAPPAPQPEAGRMEVVVIERDGNGDIKRWAIRKTKE
jgi:hypothetical protein